MVTKRPFSRTLGLGKHDVTLRACTSYLVKLDKKKEQEMKNWIDFIPRRVAFVSRLSLISITKVSQ